MSTAAVLEMPAIAMQELRPNPNRKIEINVAGTTYERLPVRTHIIKRTDDIVAVAQKYAKGPSQPGDVLFISEKVVAVTQGRAVPENEMKIGLTARILWRCVAKVPYGIGLRRPSSMQAAVNECGAARIWLAAIVGALGKLVGRKGDFYRIAGPQAAT
ncbi:MAG TPA: coenzyme F420-0:L-glutamate ligase, partial [Candidatus Sumerlaeota bacterium]|nr:coenzyme F420-0:L-glutamate ligase [Candidatus Sumerlaeota bacterium]